MKKSIQHPILMMTILSISLNFTLFLSKLFFASLVNSVALFSDAFNHFSDSLSGLIFSIGQRL
ncbi:MAG: cation transporter [Firmicutes bacterium]|nr:cation transporter [Bacillota bacterium]